MKTLVFKLETSLENLEFIEYLQNSYSISFRKMFNNLELLYDDTFLKTIPIKSVKWLEYLQKEVLSFQERLETQKTKISDRIQVLESNISKTSKDYKKLKHLRRSLKKSVCFGNKKELQKLSKSLGSKELYSKSRLMPLCFYGESSRYGNRYFDLKKISSGIVVFKYNKQKYNLSINPKRYKELERLEYYINNKLIPITIKLSKDKLYLTYDESILYNTKLEIEKYYKEIKEVKDKDLRKKLISAKHKEHEDMLKFGKLDRILAIDLNPDGIGYSVLNSNMTIVDKGYLDISKILKSNKRRYETSILVKELFKLIKHYNCYGIVVEDLNLKEESLGNKVSNRKVKNLWCRTLINQIIVRKCNELGLIKIEINPVYTSLIGNVMYNEYDPVASSIEIGRRGLKKYSKGGFYPELDIQQNINVEMYDSLKECKTWKDVYSCFVTSKQSYRRKLNKFNFLGFYLGNEKSGCKHIHFL